ncbi:MAG: T9SS type A sorting domain-containing protein [Bacteroidetes bacterium]|nr:T9SS type A sorting domain-containing protein [Bacteroidota bacterium]
MKKISYIRLYTLILGVYISCCNDILIAQSQTPPVRQWTSTFASDTTSLGNAATCLYGVTQANDGGYVGVGYSFFINGSLQPYAAKVDAQGKNLWRIVIDDNNLSAAGILYDVQPVPGSNDVVAVGFKNGLVVIRIKQDGTIAAGYPKYFNSANMTGLGTFNPIGLSLRVFNLNDIPAGWIIGGDLFSCGTYNDQYQSAGGLVIKTDLNFNMDLNFKSHSNTAGWGKYNFMNATFAYSDDRVAVRCVRPINDAGGNMLGILATGQVFDTACICGATSCWPYTPNLNVFNARINLTGGVVWKTSLDEAGLSGYVDNGPDSICLLAGAQPENSSQIGFEAEQKANGSNEMIILAGFDWTQTTRPYCNNISIPFFGQNIADLAIYSINTNTGATMANKKINAGNCEGNEFKPALVLERCSNSAYVLGSQKNANLVMNRVFKIDVSTPTYTIRWTKDALADEYGTYELNNPFGMVLSHDGGLVIAGCNESNPVGNFMLKLANDCQMNTLYDINGLTINSGTTTWNTSRKVRGTIRVKSGAKLIINANAQIEFADTRQTVDFAVLSSNSGELPTKIIVEQGASLTISGTAGSPKTTLKGLASCYLCNNGDNFNSAMWEGIEVWGNASLKQTFNNANANQGYAYLSGGAVLQDMFKGVSVDKTTYAPHPDSRLFEGYPANDGGFGGGVIVVATANGAKFLNNLYGVTISTYMGTNTNFTALSNCSFTNAIFQNNAFLKDKALVDSVGGKIVSQRQLTVHNAKQISLADCKFFGFSGTNIKKRGIGIYTNDASLKIINSGTTDNFTNLTNGIFINQSSAANQVIYIKGNRFANCYKALLTRGSRFDYVEGNNIKVKNDANYNCAVHTVGSSNYHLRQNNFVGTGATTSSTHSLGNIAESTTSMPTQVEGNTYSNLNIGTQAQRNCGTTGNNRGLQINCNTYLLQFEHAWNIAPFNPGTLPNQGQACGTTNRQAGNVFADSHTCSGGNEHHIRSQVAFTYYDANCTNCSPDCKSALVSNAGCAASNIQSCNIDDLPATQVEADSLTIKMNATSNAQNKSLMRNTLAQYYLLINNMLQAEVILQGDSSSDNGKKILIAFYIGYRKWSNAQYWLNKLIGAQGSDNQTYKTYFQVIKDVLSSGRNLKQLNASELITVRSVAITNTLAAYNAQALLGTWYNENNPILIEIGNGVIERHLSETNNQSGLILFPNPSGINVTVNAKSPMLTITVYDVSGQQVANYQLQESPNQFTMDVTQLKQGVYIARVLCENGNRINARIVVLR